MARDVLTRVARPPELSLAYGPHPDHVVDVRLPAAAAPAPLVVVVHGGFWRAEWDRAHAGPLSEALADAGYAVATVEYRRVGIRGGGWPGTFDDLALLSDTVPALVADTVRGRRVDPDRTVLVGHSAGGHLVTWAAARHRLPGGSRWHRATPLPISGVVALAGVVDLAAAVRLRLDAGAAQQLLGGQRRLADRLAVTDPIALLPSGARTVLVHGSADAQVPVELSRTYAATALEAGDPVELRELAGAGHFDLIDPLSPAWPSVPASVAALLA